VPTTGETGALGPPLPSRRTRPNGSPDALLVRLSDVLNDSPTPPLAVLDTDPRRDGADEQSESCDSRRRIAGRSSSTGSATAGSWGEPETERGDEPRGDKGSSTSSAPSSRPGGGVNRRLSVVGDAMATGRRASAGDAQVDRRPASIYRRAACPQIEMEGDGCGRDDLRQFVRSI